MDTVIVVIVIFAVLALAVILVFRHRIKIGIKGPAGTSLDIEGENAPPADPRPLDPGSKSAARSVAIGGSADGARIVTGDRNRVG
jgi:hypothetical protein